MNARRSLAVTLFAATVPLLAQAWPEANARWSVAGTADRTWLGSACWTAGDVNGDGYDDVLVGDRADVSGVFGAGHASLYLGSPAGPGTTPAWVIDGVTYGRFIGEWARGAGDVDGDGFDDVIACSSEGAPRGHALVFRGGAAGLEPTPSWSFALSATDPYLEIALAAGDVNGDGFDDVVLAAPGNDGSARPGVAWLFLGSASGLAPTPAWTLAGPDAGSRVGNVVGAGGDVNGDGLDDVVVGISHDWPGPDSHADLYLGTPTGLAPAPAWSVVTGSADQRLSELCIVGDVDGDGFDDLLEGSAVMRWTDGDPNGQIRLHSGTPSGLGVATFTWRSEDFPPPTSLEAQDSFGLFVAPAGDQDGDGRADFLVGSPTWGSDARGRAFLYARDAAGAYGTPWYAIGSQSGAHTNVGGWGNLRMFGRVAPAGDVNGDGSPDVLVGAMGEDAAGHSNAGKAYIYFGAPVPPPEPSSALLPVERFRVRRLDRATLRLTWEDGPQFPHFNVSAGTLTALSSASYDHAGWLCRLDAPVADVPIPAGGVYWLVSSMTDAGLESVVGRDSFGVPAPRPSPRCP